MAVNCAGHLLGNFQRQASLRHFTTSKFGFLQNFSFENLFTLIDAKSVLTLRLLRQKLSQISPACSPAVQVTAIWFRIT